MRTARINGELIEDSGADKYCQAEIEGRSECDNQCEHCQEYYGPLQKDYKRAKDLGSDLTIQE